jgi:Flp pilus assembly protein TadD
MKHSVRILQLFSICLLLTLSILVVFGQVRNHEFTNYDDNEYITENSAVQTGLSWQSVHWAFTSTISNHWHPLTWLSHMLDCQLFGLNPAAHHLVSMLLHIANTLLLFFVLTLATNAIWPSAFVAALFALHPLHVESVAWAAERKDVLSTFFWMLTMWAYIEYAKKPGVVKYLLALVFFALGLMAKSMLVTMPVVLLLLDFWPLERLRFTQPKDGRVRPLNIFVEKIPFFILSVISAVITIVIMQRAGYVADVVALTPKYRIANVLVSYGMYVLKMFWPSNLSPFYPHPGTTLALWKAAVAGVVLLVLSVVVFSLARRRYLITGWLWYLVTLLPVVGLLQVGSQAMADRYTYIPLVGLFIIISFGAAELFNKLRYGRWIWAASAVVIIFALMVCTYRQAGFWKNSITLFEHAAQATENNYLAYNNLSNALGQKGDYDAAIKNGLESLRIRPNYDLAHYNLAMAYYYKGDTEKAIYYWTQALRINPKYPGVNYALAAAFIKKNDTAQAIRHLEEELKLNPGHSGAQKLLYELRASNRPESSQNR